MSSKKQKRSYGTGQIHEKSGSYYGRWRTPDGRMLNRKIGKIRLPGEREGLTGTQAEREFRKMREAEEGAPRAQPGDEIPTVADVSGLLRQRLEIRGASDSYQEGCECVERLHIAPSRVGKSRPADVSTADVESLARALLKKNLAPKSVRNILSYLYSVFELAIKEKWTRENPVRGAEKPGSLSKGSSDDLEFLSVSELEAVFRAIPDETVKREPKATRRGRRGPAPPPPPDVYGPVLRRVILTAGMTGLRRGELLGLRWRDVDWVAQRIRVRKPDRRGVQSTRGKSELSTKRSVPMATRLAQVLDLWSKRTAYKGDDDLVFAHPSTGKALDGPKVSRRFKQACEDAKVHVIKFHNLRHTFGTRMAASNVPMRMLQEFMGHADSKTTQIYVHYAPSEHEVEMVDAAFVEEGPGVADKAKEAETEREQPEQVQHGEGGVEG
jgi:integrase